MGNEAEIFTGTGISNNKTTAEDRARNALKSKVHKQGCKLVGKATVTLTIEKDGRYEVTVSGRVMKLPGTR